MTAGAGDAIVATVPTWRRDLVIEADVIEEIARVHGYEEIPPTLPDTQPPPWRPSPLELREAVRETLVGCRPVRGRHPCARGPRPARPFGWATPAEAADGEVVAAGDPITVQNPISPEHAVLRQGLVGSLTEVVAGNVRNGRSDLGLFEVGKGYGRAGSGPLEWWRLGIALAGNREPAAWNRAARAADLDDLKGIVELLAIRLQLGRPEWTPLGDEPLLHPGRSAVARARRADGAIGLVGRVGELHPSLVERLDLRLDRLLVAELSIGGLSGGQLPVARIAPIVRHPAVERDLAVIVAEPVAAAAVEAVIRRSAGPLLVDLRLFDIYRGAPLAAGEKSLAERLVLRSADRTLTDPEVEAIVAGVTAALSAELGARLRT